jgi:hypothetical protein
MERWKVKRWKVEGAAGAALPPPIANYLLGDFNSTLVAEVENSNLFPDNSKTIIDTINTR